MDMAIKAHLIIEKFSSVIKVLLLFFILIFYNQNVCSSFQYVITSKYVQINNRQQKETNSKI